MNNLLDLGQRPLRIGMPACLHGRTKRLKELHTGNNSSHTSSVTHILRALSLRALSLIVAVFRSP